MNAAAAKNVAGRGQKTCGECGEINGARAGKCKKCGHVFVVAEASGSTRKAKAHKTLQAMFKAVEEMGGIKAVESALKKLEAVQEVQAQLDKIGGIEAARGLVGMVKGAEK